MRRLFFLLACALFLLLGAGCGKKNIEKQTREVVRQFDGLDLPRSSVEVIEVNESGDYAVAEVKVTTALKLRKKDGRWEIDEIRLGDRRWEPAAHILAVLNRERSQTTRKQMESLREGIRNYQADRGRVPEVGSFEALVDELTPRFMRQVIRLDAWSNPFSYEALGTVQFELRSPGPDGALQTGDDLILREAP